MVCWVVSQRVKLCYTSPSWAQASHSCLSVYLSVFCLGDINGCYIDDAPQASQR